MTDVFDFEQAFRKEQERHRLALQKINRNYYIGVLLIVIITFGVCII
jgi:hypothetical protein